MADHHAGHPVEGREPGDDRGVVRELAVAVKLHEILEEVLDEVERVRAQRMASDEGLLPGAQPVEKLFRKLFELLFEVRCVLARLGELFDLAPEGVDRFFDGCQVVGHSRER